MDGAKITVFMDRINNNPAPTARGKKLLPVTKLVRATTYRFPVRLDFWPLFIIVQEVVVMICKSLARISGDGICAIPPY
jgi:hypothetical protein